MDPVMHLLERRQRPPGATGPPPVGGPYGKYGLVALWVEAIIYGLYLPLFIPAFNIMRRRDRLRTPTSRYLLGGMTLMFVFITFNTIITCYTMLKLYVTDTNVAPIINGVRPPMPWDVYLFVVMLTVVGWITDVIMIYRVYLIWSRNIWVTLLPSAVLIVSLASGSFNFWYTLHFDKFNPRKATLIRGLWFPMSLVNSLLTTGLISYRIWTQHRRMSAAGVKVATGRGGQTSLVMVLRIIIEGAMIWTVVMLVTAVLFFMDHQSAIIVKHASVPCAGIVFALITIRTQNARNAHPSSVASEQATSFALPGWMVSGGDTTNQRTAVDFERSGDGRQQISLGSKAETYAMESRNV